MRHLLSSSLALLIVAVLVVPMDAGAKRKKVQEEQPPPPEPATFQVYGTIFQDQHDYEYGKREDCDLFIYLVEGGQAVTDATVTVGEHTLTPDSWFAGRYRVLQQCIAPGTVLPIHIQRANQFWNGEVTMAGYPVFTAPALNAEVPATEDITLTWQAAEGAQRYRVDVDGIDQHWVTSEPKLVISKAELPPYQHHKITLTAYGTAVDPDAAAAPLSGAEATWPGLNPVTRVHTEFDFGPGLMGQNWAGQQVIRWWLEDGKTYDEELFKVWLVLNKDGTYILRRVKIGFFEQGMLNGTEIPWEFYDTGVFHLGEAGVLELESGESEITWSATYADPALSLLKILPPTEDDLIKKQRRHDGPPEPWELQIEEVEPVVF